MEERRKVLEEAAAAQLAEWNAQMALLKAKAQQATVDAKVEYDKTLDFLQVQANLAKLKLDELKAANEGAWESLKVGSEKVWADVKLAFHDAAAKYQTGA